MTFFKTLWADQNGASAAEYALILAIVGTGIAMAAWGLGGAIGNSMNKATNCIASSSANASTNCQ
jgi:pilus assembly protein Flp/PilA